ncbi:MAG: cytochrome c-type biogenesis protein [Gemmatirosa sp.]
MSSSQSPQYAIGGYVLSRRRFVAALGAGWATAAGTAAAGGLLARPLHAQTSAQAPTTEQSAASNVPMDQGAAKSVRRPPKPGATPVVDQAARDALEHQIKCQCGCTLDVYTCRTTDFSCQVSPAMHRDVMSLVEGGHSADEIIAAFVDTYGQQVLMAPKREGFNLAGYVMPFAALGTGAVVVAALIRKWGRRAAAVQAAHVAQGGGRAPVGVDASADELARLEAAVRGETR